jgi:hypothetical protein
MLEIRHAENSQEFSRIDSSLQRYNEIEDCEEAAVGQIVAESQKASDKESDEDHTPEREGVTNQDVSELLVDNDSISCTNTIKAVLYLH